MINNVVHNAKGWEGCVEEVISEPDIKLYWLTSSDLTMINLFRTL